MIIDLQKFLASERPYWLELESIVNRLEQDPSARLDWEKLKRFQYLYERTSADLARLVTFASEPEVRQYVESLIGRAYGEIHESRGPSHRFRPDQWFLRSFPRTFRRHLHAFMLSVGITAAGVAFGVGAMAFDPDAKPVLMPFPHLQMNPAERVAQEEEGAIDRLAGSKSTFSTFLMTHNTKVAILTLALGMTCGLGTILLLFYNGVILGAVAFDYLQAGQGAFLAGWLLPHGSIEIPSILIAGQAGLVLAGALVGRGKRGSLRARLRAVMGDVVVLIFGVGVLLVWAGLVEAFFSQYHAPVIPYPIKISFGLVELALLTLFLARASTLTPVRTAAPFAYGDRSRTNAPDPNA